MNTELVHVGFGNVIAMNKVLAIVAAGSEPITRMVQAARGKDLLIDLTNGRRTKAVIIMDSGHIVVVALNAETIAGRITSSQGTQSMGK